MRCTLAGVAIVFSLGICAAARLKLPFCLAFSAALLLLISALFAQRKTTIFNTYLVCVLLFTGMAAFANAQRLPPCHISKYFTLAYQNTCVLKGMITDEPRRKESVCYFRFRTREIEIGGFNRNCCGEILVRAKTRQPLNYGQVLIMKGNMYLYRRILYIRVKSSADILLLDRQGSKIMKLAIQMRRLTKQIISRSTSPVASGIICAMILGDKEDVPRWIMDAMSRSGTVHILVVSGYNVGMVALVIYLVLKVARLPRRMRLVLTIPLLVLYCLITGASEPVVRATIMALAFVASRLLRRESDIYTSLSLAALIILAADPRQLFDISFQLSFASVISIVSIYPKIRIIFGIDNLKNKCLRFITEGCLVSFSAWLGTMGLIAYYFKVFSPVTVLANVVIVPLAGLLTLCGFSQVITGIILPPLAPYTARTNEFLVFILISLNSLFLKIPGSCFHL